MPTSTLVLFAAVAVIYVIGRFRPKPPKVDRTIGAKLGGRQMTTDADIIAGVGSEKPAPQTLNEHIMRPTFGLRLVSVLLSLAVYRAVVWQPTNAMGPAPLEMHPWLAWVMIGLAVYGVVHINTYELRYDRDRIVHRTWAFQTREASWREVISIRDGGGFYYVLRFEKGWAMWVHKYLVGAHDFVAYTHLRIAENDSV